MACSGAFLQSYFFWSLLSGVAAGSAVGQVVVRLRSLPQRVRHWRWIGFAIFASISVSCALAGAFLPSLLSNGMLQVPETFLDIRLLYLFCGTLLVVAAGIRFPRSVGIPLLVIVVVFTLSAVVVAQPWRCMNSQEPVATLRALSSGSEGVELELIHSSSESSFFSLTDNQVYIKITLLQTSEWYFFSAKPFLYRVVALGGGDGEGTGDGVAYEPEEGPIENLSDALAQIFEKLPGWEVETLILSLKNPVPLYRYGVFLRPDGSAVFTLLP